VATPQFSGSVPANYDKYLGPVLFEPYAADLAARLPDGDGLRVLELACGTGIVTRRLREALGDSGTVVATDLSEAMVAYARDAVPAPGIEWQAADAQALAFDDGSFDVVVCQFGFMLLADKVQGFREARRVLDSDGLLLANVWHSLDVNRAVGAVHASLAELFPDDPPRFLETPYGYHDSERIRADMSAAGWEDVQLEDVRLRGLAPSAADFAAGFTLGTPLAHELAERLGRKVQIVGTEAATAWLTNTEAARRLFGSPSVPLTRMLDWTVDWIARGLPMLDKPTHFEVRDGAY
jgi:SAM-dependent methyltransferase